MNQHVNNIVSPDASVDDEKLNELMSTDSGAREVIGWQRKFFLALAFIWALNQLMFASGWHLMLGAWTEPIFQSLGLNFTLAFGEDKQRVLHLTFAMLLVFLAYPAYKKAPKDRAPWYDIILAFCGACAVFYAFVFWDAIQLRDGNPSMIDISVGVVGVIILLEATRRSLGPPLVIIAILASTYMLFGNQPWLGDFAAGNISYRAFINAQWISQTGVFGTPLSVSTKVVFVFVLFGALLEKAGAGSYFIRCAFVSLGFLRGGPAKAAVVASGLTGLISGSSIANTVTTGTFTIPMMKRVGFNANKAGAVEVSSSVNGQLMPPVMGAAAFLMEANIDGLNYPDIVKHAFLPAIISYIALVYIVHLEACKNQLPLLERGYEPPKFAQSLMRFALAIITICAFSFAAYYIVSVTNKIFGDLNVYVMSIALIAIYVALVKYCSRFDVDFDSDLDIPVPLPKPLPVFLSGLYYLLPVTLLVWCLMVLRLSTGKSAFLASLLLIFIMVTQRPLIHFFKHKKDMTAQVKKGFKDVFDGMISGSRSMITIALATATAGIVVAMVTQTGVGNKFSYLIVALVGDNIILILMATAVLSLILGMGLPTTANYIIVSTLMVPVVIELGSANGLIIPAIAAHMFCFYFGIMADVTPPVGLASIAASAISKGDPIKTGGFAFYYSLRTAVLPFMFVFNTNLLLWNVSLTHGLLVSAVATVAILIFTAALQGWFITKTKIWEIVALLLVAFTLFQPRFWLDQISPRFTTYESSEIMATLNTLDTGDHVRILMQPKPQNENAAMPFKQYHVFELGEGDAEQRLESYGFYTYSSDDKLLVDMVQQFDSTFKQTQAYEKKMLEDSELLLLEVENERMMEEIFWIPAILLLIFIYWMQKMRVRKEELGAIA